MAPAFRGRAWLERIPSVLVRTAHWSHVDQFQHAVHVFLYDVFDPAVQLVQLASRRQATFHASAIATQGRRVIFLADGGVGKTSTLLKAMASPGTAYLADDLVVLDTNAEAHLYPRRVQVYASTYGEVHPSHPLEHTAALDRVSWSISTRVRGPARTRRRLTPRELFGEARIDPGGPVTDLVYLRPSSRFKVTQRVWSTDEVDQIVRIAANETKLNGPIPGKLASIGFPTQPSVSVALTSLLRSVAGQAETWVADLPRTANQPPSSGHLLTEMGL